MQRFFSGLLLIGLLYFTFHSTSYAMYPAPSPTKTYRDDEFIVKYKAGQSITGQTAFRTLQIQQLNTSLGITSSENLFYSDSTFVNSDELGLYRLVHTDGSHPIEDAISQYNDQPEVDWAKPNSILTIQATPNDSLYPQMWGLQKIKADQAWDVTKGSDNITVAVIDTGADYNNTDLAAHLLPGYNALIGAAGGQDDQGHGSHVSGTIGAVTNNGQGVAGINWNVKVLPVKVLDSQGVGDEATVARGIQYAAAQAEAKNIKVINMSLGGCRNSGSDRSKCTDGTGGDSCQTLNPALEAAVAKNITVVVAAGNAGDDVTKYAPAACNGVIVVGATTQTDTKASFSNFGSLVNLSAPGVDIKSTWYADAPVDPQKNPCPGQDYCSLQGTSMASPHVAGVVALMYAANGNINPSQVKTILSTASNLDPINQTGAGIGMGRLNALKAVQAASQQTTNQLTATPTVTVPPGDSNPTPTVTPTGQPGVTLAAIPTPPVYACTPQSLPQITAPEACACQSGVCNAQCQFALSPTPGSTTGTPTPTITGSPIDTACTDAAPSQGDVQITQNMTATASNYLRSLNNDYAPDKAIDGNAGTVWNSQYAAPQWIEINLGQPKTIKSLQLSSNFPLVQAYTNKIYAGSSPNPQTLVKQLGCTIQTHGTINVQFAQSLTNIQYIRVLTEAPANFVSWSEIRVFAPNPNTPTSTPTTTLTPVPNSATNTPTPSVIPTNTITLTPTPTGFACGYPCQTASQCSPSAPYCVAQTFSPGVTYKYCSVDPNISTCSSRFPSPSLTSIPHSTSSPNPTSGTSTASPTPDPRCANVAGYSCTTLSACTSGRSFGSGMCPQGTLCCYKGNTLGVSTQDGNSPTGMKCSNSAGQDTTAFCKRPLRTLGDADGDGKVTVTDYLYLVRGLNNRPLPSTVTVDFNGDGAVNDTDKQIMISALKTQCY